MTRRTVAEVVDPADDLILFCGVSVPTRDRCPWPAPGALR